MDYQVSILMLVIISISCSLVAIFVYNTSYDNMLASLENRGDAVLQYVEANMNPTIFTEITEQSDMSGQLYMDTHVFLKNAREATGAKYLYTATYNENKELIYHVDGLPQSSPDFRVPGDLIEEEFKPDLMTAMAGDAVLSGEILLTEWGEVFVAYYPIRYAMDGSVIGALGLEFSAGDQYALYIKLRNFTVIFIGVVCFIASVISRIMFQRISNPHFQDIYNTDSLTGLKNRIAYDLDVNNLIQRNALQNYMVMLADLNGLKMINDKYGHKLGDFYISAAAKALALDSKKDHVIYRIGGDEFVVLFNHHNKTRAHKYIHNMRLHLTELCADDISGANIAVGISLCEGSSVEHWEKAQEQADFAMYADKKEFYRKNRELDARRMKS